MNNTIPSLLNRVLKLKDDFQRVGADAWNAWSTGGRAGFILGSLDGEAARYDDSSIYNIFFKAYHSSKHSSIHLTDLDFSQVMEVLDIAERFSKNWIFS